MRRRWSSDDLPDLRGRVAVVTGANSGIGYATALGLAARGARVVATARSARLGEEALARMRAAVPGAAVELRLLDLADLGSIERFAARVAATTDAVDILVNNAGVMAVPGHLTTAQGFELQFGTNHLGHFALTGRLLPLLLARPAARVVTVSSLAHRGASIDFEDLDSATAYLPWQAYGRSKLANVLFFKELDRRSRRAGRSLVSAGAHPGLTATNLASAGPRLAALTGERQRPTARSAALLAASRLLGQPQRRGALPSLYAAAAPGVEGGAYFGPAGPGEVRGAPRRREVSAAGRDPAAARRLWELSEELTSVGFEALGSPAS